MAPACPRANQGELGEPGPRATPARVWVKAQRLVSFPTTSELDLYPSLLRLCPQDPDGAGKHTSQPGYQQRLELARG
jgi:hypothetical protein